MICSLPSLAPRDSHTLWYTSNNHTNDYPGQHETVGTVDHGSTTVNGQNSGSYPLRRGHHGSTDRSPLARLRADELYMERRKQNVQNYGSSWIKPPGVVKSLHQLREEKRELEEHQEALRREQLAHELAEAEAADELLQGEGGDGEMEELRDLDDDIPEAADLAEIDPGESASEDDLDQDGSPRESIAQRISDNTYRDALIGGNEGRNHRYGSEHALASDDEDGSQILHEDDLVHDQGLEDNENLNMDMDMDADLDSGVPESAIGGYEHTDTEEELTSSDDEGASTGRLQFGPDE